MRCQDLFLSFPPTSGTTLPVISQTIFQFPHATPRPFSTLLQAAPSSPTRATPLGSKGEAFLSAV